MYALFSKVGNSLKSYRVRNTEFENPRTLISISMYRSYIVCAEIPYLIHGKQSTEISFNEIGRVRGVIPYRKLHNNNSMNSILHIL